MIKQISILVAGIGLSGWLTLAAASPVTLPNTFTSGTRAVAAQVNANFVAVKTATDDNNSRIAVLEAKNTALEARIAALESKMATVNNSQVMALDAYLTVDTTSDPRGPLVQFHDANVQVVNGLGRTDSANGLGNLIIGYDEANTSGTGHCTIGTNPNDGKPVNANTCSNAGGTWMTTGFKTGSHYLVVGTQNNYSRWGGVVLGIQNTSNYDYASVLGGYNNTASGQYSSVSGGRDNTASGQFSSVSGGRGNTASGQFSSVSGGSGNTASKASSSVSGGGGNTASGGESSSVSGGYNNTASGMYSSVSGGTNNTAGGENSSVSGGSANTAKGAISSVSGGGGNTASGDGSSVSGGTSVSATTNWGWAAGTYSSQ